MSSSVLHVLKYTIPVAVGCSVQIPVFANHTESVCYESVNFRADLHAQSVDPSAKFRFFKRTVSPSDLRAREVKMNRLRELCLLEERWNGGSGVPLEPDSVSNMTALIQNSRSEILDKVVLFPNVNGTLILQSADRNRLFAMSVGNCEFSYTYDDAEGMPVEGKEAWDLKRVRQILRSVFKQ